MTCTISKAALSLCHRKHPDILHTNLRHSIMKKLGRHTVPGHVFAFNPAAISQCRRLAPYLRAANHHSKQQPRNKQRCGEDGGGCVDQAGRRTPPFKTFKTSTISKAMAVIFQSTRAPSRNIRRMAGLSEKGGSTRQAGAPFLWQHLSPWTSV
jgi:hypothetical protein